MRWYYIIDDLAAGDWLRWDDVLARRTEDALEGLNFHAARNYADARQYDYEQKLKK